MSKSVAEQEKYDVENVPSDMKLTRNRRQLLQRQQKSSEEGPDDPEADNNNNNNGDDVVDDNKRTPTPEEKSDENDPEKDRPSSDYEKKTTADLTEPSQLLIDSSSSSSSSLKQRLAKAKNTMPLKEDENAEKKTDYPMKTRSGRSSLPVIKKKIKPTVNNGTGKNILTKRRRGKPALNATNNNHNASNYRASRKSKKLYDEAGALLSNGKDYCDCLETDCPGCHFPCKKCGSEKCGTECRCERAWIYDEVKIEGLGITLKNSAC